MTPVGPGHSAVLALGDERAEPDVAWVAALTGASPEQVQATLAETDRFVALEEDIRRKHTEAGREFYAQLRAPLEMYALVRLAGAHCVVETGVSSGVSSAHFLLGLQQNGGGTLHSIDLPTHQRETTLGKSESPVSLPPGRASGWAIPDQLRSGWDLHLGPSQVLLPVLVRSLATIDLFLHDSLHTSRHLTFELEAVRPKLRPGAIVLADNTEWTGDAFGRFARSLGTPVLARGKSDLVGLRVPVAKAAVGRSVASPRARAKGTTSNRATRSR